MPNYRCIALTGHSYPEQWVEFDNLYEARKWARSASNSGHVTQVWGLTSLYAMFQNGNEWVDEQEVYAMACDTNVEDARWIVDHLDARLYGQSFEKVVRAFVDDMPIQEIEDLIWKLYQEQKVVSRASHYSPEGYE